MPKLPHVSGSEAVRALQQLGFEVARQRGSHIIMRRGSDGCVVPNHREIKTGHLRACFDRQASLRMNLLPLSES
jgi:predicted RNA binding protein YcfA (HicA-like mRNA interferase family)